MDIIGDAIKAMRAGDPRAARAKLQAPWGLRFTPSGGAGVHVVLRGSAWLLRPDKEPIEMSAGDVALVSRARPHAIADSPSSPVVDVAADTRVYWPDEIEISGGSGTTTIMVGGAYYLDQTRPHPVIATLPEVIHLPFHHGQNPSVHSVVGLLGAELEEDRPGISAAIPALLDLLLLYVVRTWYERHADQDTGWAAALRDQAIAAALERIQRNPETHWTVDSLARQSNLSRAAFARRFTALVGLSPVAYLTWWRMTTATRLLQSTDYPLAAIATRVGYASEFGFAKAFKRELGVAPGSYRDDP